MFKIRNRYLKMTSVALFCWATTLPLSATANVCDPDQSLEFSVSGVRADDTLNVRSGPTTEYPVVAELLPNEVGIRYGGDKYFLDWECQALCRKVSNGRPELFETAQSQCFQKNKVWFEIITPASTIGWVSAKYLSSSSGQQTSNSPQVQEDENDLSTENGIGSINAQEFSNFVITRSILNVCAKYGYITPSTMENIRTTYDDYTSELPLPDGELANFEKMARESDLVRLYQLSFAQSNGIFNYDLQTDCNDFTGAFLAKQMLWGQ